MKKYASCTICTVTHYRRKIGPIQAKRPQKASILTRSPGQFHEFERIRGLIDPESKTSKSAPLLKVWSDNINQVVIPNAVEGSIEIVPKASFLSCRT
jgi:hypothetical protein